MVEVGWNDTTSSVSSVTDSNGNSYALAVGPTRGTGLSQSIYYAKNIVGGSNTVTVTFSKAAAIVDLRALEYSGLDTGNPLDATAGASGTGTSGNSGAATTSSANELIVGAGMTLGAFTKAGTGFTSSIITSPDADIAEDLITTATGSYSATAPTSTSTSSGHADGRLSRGGSAGSTGFVQALGFNQLGSVRFHQRDVLQGL